MTRKTILAASLGAVAGAMFGVYGAVGVALVGAGVHVATRDAQRRNPPRTRYVPRRPFDWQQWIEELAYRRQHARADRDPALVELMTYNMDQAIQDELRAGTVTEGAPLRALVARLERQGEARARGELQPHRLNPGPALFPLAGGL